MIEAVNRLQKLNTFISYFTSIPGKKALQKLMYLYQEISGEKLYSYQWFPYGPYSSILEDDLQLGIEKEEITYDLEPHAHIKLNSSPQNSVQQAHLNPHALNQLNKIYNEVKTTKNLELLASLLFLLKSHGENAIAELQKRKPGKFTEKDIKNALQTLKKHQLIP